MKYIICCITGGKWINLKKTPYRMPAKIVLNQRLNLQHRSKCSFRVFLGSQYGKQWISSSKIRGYIREKNVNKDCISNKLQPQYCQEFERENPKREMLYEIDTKLTYLEKVTIRKLTSNYQSFESKFYLCSIMSLYIVILLLLLHSHLIL